MDDDYLEDLKEEIVEAKRLAVDENGKVLVWVGDGGPAAAEPEPERREAVAGEETAEAPEAERRQLTVMFCDLVDSTGLSERLDAEDLREVIRDYQRVASEAIRSHLGHVAQFLGDGLLVYFGYPHAQEDDALRAVRAGREIVRAVGRLNARLVGERQIELAVRVGIHTGRVVVGEMGDGRRQEQLATGETPIIAARLQAMAAPDSVVIGAVTHSLVRGWFTFNPLGSPALKGVSQPVAAYAVTGESSARSRFEAASAVGLTPFVGRRRELERLLALGQGVFQGAGGTVLVCGEAGIGKTRLVEELASELEEKGAAKIEFHCLRYYRGSALFPAIDYLQRMLGFRRDDSPAQKLDKLERGLERYRFATLEVVTLLAAILSLPQDRYPPLSLSPQRRKKRTNEALLDWLAEESGRRPVLFIWEDLQWADPSSLDLLDLFVERAPLPSLLAILTFRPGFEAPWEEADRVVRLDLAGLERRSVESIIDRLTERKALPGEVVRHLVDKTDGVPLFVEELTKEVLESGVLHVRQGSLELSRPLREVEIPSTIQDSLMSRLDRLTEGKEVAHLGATFGREFADDLIRAVWPKSPEALDRGLEQLRLAELLRRRKRGGSQTHWVFKHALIQDTAYHAMLRRTRRRNHERIARVLERTRPEIVAAHPEIVAHHYSQAGLEEPAIRFWQDAGREAMRRSANVEAEDHLQRGLEMVRSLPASPERTHRELSLLVTLGGLRVATRGYAAPEVGLVFTEARELCRQIGESPELFETLQGIWAFYLVRADLKSALDLAEALVDLAQRLEDEALLLEAVLRLGISQSVLGDLTPAREHFDRVRELFDPERHGSHVYQYGQDPLVSCLCHLSWVLWALGYPDRALASIRDAVTRAKDLSHPFTLSWALLYLAIVHSLRRERLAVREHAASLIALCEEQGFAYRLAQGRILEGWALAETGAGAERQVREGIEAVRVTGARVYRPYYLALLAETCERQGQPEAGQVWVEKALDEAEQTSEAFFRAELLRLQGELLEASAGDPAEVEACFERALEVAREQGARSLELRAAVSMARLCAGGDRSAEARERLARVYAAFDEGLETADLREAAELLD